MLISLVVRLLDGVFGRVLLEEGREGVSCLSPFSEIAGMESFRFLLERCVVSSLSCR
jgi:hypothetical protein